MAEPYDVNFCLPIRELSNDRVKLTPFIPSKHAHTFFTLSSPHPSLFAHLPFGPFPSEAAFTTELIENRIHTNPALTLFAIIDKTQPEDAIAGTIGLLNTSPQHLSTEIGFVIILPPFQRTHVTSNAVGLLLAYTLDLPDQGGLGLRRVQWQANAGNAASVRAAERMGFRMEAVVMWDRVLRGTGKVGNGKAFPRGGEEEKGIGRDSAMLSFCWDDWEDGGREKVKNIMERRQ